MDNITPVFEYQITGGANIRIWADGRCDGLAPGAMTNRLLPLMHFTEALILEKAQAMHPGGSLAKDQDFRERVERMAKAFGTLWQMRLPLVKSTT